MTSLARTAAGKLKNTSVQAQVGQGPTKKITILFIS